MDFDQGEHEFHQRSGCMYNTVKEVCLMFSAGWSVSSCAIFEHEQLSTVPQAAVSHAR